MKNKRPTQGRPKRSGDYKRNDRFKNVSKSSPRKGGRPSRNNRSKSKSKNIDITTFIHQAQKEAGNNKVFDIKHTFNDFNLHEIVNKNLARMKFISPTPIQDASMVHILEGEDVIGLANTGTGKTGAFLLPLISKVLENPQQRTLIIVPTRELVLQIDNELREFSTGGKIRSATVIGGVSQHKQVHNLLRDPHFVIGTPGRLTDLLEQNKLKLKKFNTVVLDEVDRMLDMGFLGPVRNLIAQTNEKRQSLFFSATMPDPIKKLTEEFMKDPVVVHRQAGRTTSNVSQEVITLHDVTAKFNELKRILEDHPKAKVIIFVATKRGVERLAEMLKKIDIKADSIHGDKSQYQRQQALDKFKKNIVDILVATDVAARGLDIKGIDIVVNYSVPESYDDYVHRIGRTGRADAKGRAITFVVNE
jgi:superfamily II DNA/RNA helicase